MKEACMGAKHTTPHREINKIFSSIARSNRISEFCFDELGPIFITRKDPEAGDWVIRDEFGYVFNRKTMEWERERHGTSAKDEAYLIRTHMHIDEAFSLVESGRVKFDPDGEE
jgi:frataxin-like iron-binding protein CyaY